MNAGELIKALQSLPQDAEVFHVWDGEPRTGINHVWLSRGGEVMTADYGMPCYSDEHRPLDAPTEEEERHWETPKQK